jgi:hypothetical protein
MFGGARMFDSGRMFGGARTFGGARVFGGAHDRSGRFGEATSFFFSCRESNLDFSVLRKCGVRKFEVKRFF